MQKKLMRKTWNMACKLTGFHIEFKLDTPDDHQHHVEAYFRHAVV